MKPISRSRMTRLAIVAVPALMLMACAESHVPQMNAVDMTGNDFDRQLARNYKELSNFEAYKMYDWSDAVTYADKAMASAAAVKNTSKLAQLGC